MVHGPSKRQSFRKKQYLCLMKKALITLLFLLAGCVAASAQYFTGFSVNSYKITSAWPTSFRSVAGRVSVNIGNTGDTRAMSGIRATVYRGGRRFAHGTCEDVTFYRGTASYVLKGQVSLAQGVSTWEAIRAALSFKASEYTVDFTIDITHPDGHTDHVARTGVPITKYLHR